MDVLRYDRVDPACAARGEALLARMTLAEKVGQLVQMAPWGPFDADELAAQPHKAETTGQADKPYSRDKEAP